MGNVALAQEETFTSEDGLFEYKLDENDKVIITNYNGSSTNLVVPSQIDGYDVRSLAEWAIFSKNLTTLDVSSIKVFEYESIYCPKLSTLTLGEAESIAIGYVSSSRLTKVIFKSTNIPANACNGFSDLKEVNFEGITSIGDYAFNGCGSLTGNLTLPVTVNNIGNYALSGTGYEVVIFQNVNKLPVGVLANANNLKSVVALSITEIGDFAFKNCDALNNVTAYNVERVGVSAFEDCDNITTTTLDFSKLKTIGDKAFYKSSLDGTLTLSANLESVGSNAFANTGLDAVVLKSNPSMGTNAFNNSNMLTLEILDETVLDFDNTNTYGKVTYTRNSITANKYAGVILPFVPKENANQVFYQLGDKSNADVVEFNRVATADLEKNTPYLFKNMGATGAVTFESNGAPVTIGGNTPKEITGGSWKANGVYSTQSNMVSNGLLYSISGGDFTRYDQNLTVKPYRVYWTAPAKLSAIKFRAGDEDVTAIDFAEIDGFESVPATYYDLTGRRVLEPVKGNLYIVNGKKMVY